MMIYIGKIYLSYISIAIAELAGTLYPNNGIGFIINLSIKKSHAPHV